MHSHRFHYCKQRAIDYIYNYFKGTKTVVWTVAIDPELNDQSYIIGLGDAGDLAFGEKYKFVSNCRCRL